MSSGDGRVSVRAPAASERSKRLGAVTIADVARAASVSPKTVSRVLNNEPLIRETTRERVEQAIQALDYHPNPLARSLVTKQTRTLGLIVPDIANPFFAGGIDGCVAGAERHGYNLFLNNAGDDPAREERQIRALLTQRVAGLILWVSNVSNVDLWAMMERVKHVCPVVFIDRPMDQTSAPELPHGVVLAAQEYVGTLATQHLLNQGRQRIAHIGVTGPGSGGWVAVERLQGYEQALASNGIDPADHLIRRVAHATIREGTIATATLLAQRPQPDAIFAFNDLLAVGALLACRAARVRVPEDVAIVGVDDTEMAAVTSPPLTTIRLHQYQTGEQAMTRLLGLLDKAPPLVNPTPVLPMPDLIARSSSMSGAGTFPDVMDHE